MIPIEVRASADAVADAVRFAASRGQLAPLLPDASVHLGLGLVICLRLLQLHVALVELEGPT